MADCYLKLIHVYHHTVVKLKKMKSLNCILLLFLKCFKIPGLIILFFNET